MKDFTNTTANVGQKNVAIDSLVQTSASKAYIIGAEPGRELPVGVQNASYQGQDAASIRVAVDDAELESYVASAGSVVEVVELPASAAARAKLLAEWTQKIAKKNKAGLLPLLLLPLAACGGSDDPALTFVVTESDGDASFSGTETGPITVDVSGTVASFERGDLTAATTISNLFASGSPKELVVASGQTVIVDGDDVNGGALKASGAGNLTVDARDDVAGEVTAVSFAVDIAMGGGTLTFDMTDDVVDSVTLTGGTINLGGGTLVVSDGVVNALGVTFANVGSVVLNSELIVTLAQFQALGGTYTGSGTLTINPSSAEGGDADAVTGLADGSIKSLVLSLAEFDTMFGSPTVPAKLAKLASDVSIKLTDTTIPAERLNDLDALTTGLVDASSATSITGAVADVKEAIASTGIATSTTYAVSLTGGAVSVADANIVDADTTGVVTAEISDNDMTALAGLTGTGNAYTITVTDPSVAAGALNALDGKTTVTITATAVTTLTGSVADIKAAIASTGITTSTSYNATITDASISVADANIVDADTSGVVTATITEGDMATLAGLTGTGNAYTVTVTDASVDAAALNTLDGKTTVNVIATAVGTLTGAAADVATAISATTIDTAANVAVTLSADEAAATDLYTIDLNTSAWADASAVTKVNGTIADTLFVLDARGLNFKPDVAAGVNDTAIDAGALRALDAKTTGTITLTGFGQTITGTLSDVNAVLGTAGREASAAVVVTDSISAAEAETLAGLTTGIVTATVTGDQADDLNAALTNTALDVLSLTVLEDTVATDAADLLALVDKTAGTIDVSNVTAIQGTVAELTAAAGVYGKADIVGLGDEAITENSGGAISVANANALAALTTGVVTASLSGTASTLASLNGTGNAYTLTVSDEAVAIDIADLLALNAATTVSVNVAAIDNSHGLSGTYSEIKALFAAAAEGEFTGLAANLPISVDDTSISVSQANEINALTSGAVTATISTGDMATLNTLEGSGNVYAVTVTDTSATASDLLALDGKTTSSVNATAVTTLTGSLTDINNVLAAETAPTMTIADNFVSVVVTGTIDAADAQSLTTDARIGSGVVTATVTGDQADDLNAALTNTALDVLSLTVLEDTVATDAADLLALVDKTAGTIDVSNVTAIQGTVAELTAAAGVYGKADIVGLGDEAITENSGGAISVANANALAALTTGVVTASLSGTASTLAGLNGTGNAYTLTVSDEAVAIDIADLLALNAATTVSVNVAAIDNSHGLSGTYSEIKALFAAAAEGEFTGLAANLPISVDDTSISVSQANEINALTSGAVTATISTGDMATLNTLEGSGNVYAVTVTDTSATASDLLALDGKTTSSVNATAVTTLTGSLTDINNVLAAETAPTMTIADNFVSVVVTGTIDAADAQSLTTDARIGSGVVTATVTGDQADDLNAALTNTALDVLSLTVLEDTVATDAADLLALVDKTAGTIDVSNVTAIQGTVAELTAAAGVYGKADIVGLGDEAITENSGGAISVANANALAALTTGVVTATVDATGATGANLATLAGNSAQFAGTITNLTLDVPTATAAASRENQFVAAADAGALTDVQVQALLSKASGGVSIDGNDGADWMDLRGFDTSGVSLTINAVGLGGDVADGNNVIYSGDGNDTITTGTGADYIEVGGGVDNVSAGDGDDTIAVRSLDNVDGSVYNGGLGTDTLTVYGTNDLTKLRHLPASKR